MYHPGQLVVIVLSNLDGFVFMPFEGKRSFFHHRAHRDHRAWLLQSVSSVLAVV